MTRLKSIFSAASGFIPGTPRYLGRKLNRAVMQRCETAEVRDFIQRGATLNEKNAQGETPLFIAAARDWGVDVVKEFLKAGASLEEKSHDGCSPLLNAAHWRNKEVVQILVEAGADPNSQNNGCTPLMLMADSGHLEAVQALMEAGARLDEQDSLGRTALWHAACMGQLQNVSALLKAGADISIRDSKGQTALDIAHERCTGAEQIIQKEQKKRETLAAMRQAMEAERVQKEHHDWLREGMPLKEDLHVKRPVRIIRRKAR